MTMNQTGDQDWTNLGNTWREQDSDPEFSEHELQTRLRHHRRIEALVVLAEWVSLAVAIAAAVWILRESPARRPGLILIEWLLLQATVVLWMRRRQRAQPDVTVLDRLDASIEREARLVESMRLGGVMGLIALAAMIVAVAVSLHSHPMVTGTASLIFFLLLFVYVFAVQIAIMVYARRVRRRRQRFESIRRALRGTE